jgi:hypothetical protein
MQYHTAKHYYELIELLAVKGFKLNKVLKAFHSPSTHHSHFALPVMSYPLPSHINADESFSAYIIQKHNPNITHHAFIS